MQSTCSSSSFSFFLVIGVKVAKTATSFLAFQGTYLHSDLFICRCST